MNINGFKTVRFADILLPNIALIFIRNLIDLVIGFERFPKRPEYLRVPFFVLRELSTKFQKFQHSLQFSYQAKWRHVERVIGFAIITTSFLSEFSS